MIQALSADPSVPVWWNAIRFGVMLMGAILVGLMIRWARLERRRQYMLLGAGVTVLVFKSLIGTALRYDEALSYRVPMDIVAFSLLIAGLYQIAVKRRI